MNRLAGEESPESVTVTIKRPTLTRTAEGDATLTEPTGTSVDGYAYRRNPQRNRVEAPHGTATVQTQIILSVPTTTTVAKGDIVYFPACRVTAGVATRSIVQQVRSYPDRLQCDMEYGAESIDSPSA